MKSAFKRALMIPGLAAPFGAFRRGRAVIFMLHRFRNTEAGIDGIDPADLRRGLEYLRRKRYDLVSLTEVFQRLAAEGRPLDRSVAFTMDDGYFDQATVAGPIFAHFDCPVTTFVSTGFLDRRLWFWWDRIEYIFERTGRSELRVRLGSNVLTYSVADRAARARACQDFVERCKEIPDGLKEAGVRDLATAAEIEVPDKPPHRYAPMSWEQLRKCEEGGMSFGPHTVTHPVLGRTDSVEARREIVESWERLTAEAQRPIPIFCYPIGRWRDFGVREIAVLKREGFTGAVVGESGYANVGSFQRDGDGPFKVQRFSYPPELSDLVQVVSGVERLKQIVRREP